MFRGFYHAMMSIGVSIYLYEVLMYMKSMQHLLLQGYLHLVSVLLTNTKHLQKWTFIVISLCHVLFCHGQFNSMCAIHHA
jgi:hypothetical protein